VEPVGAPRRAARLRYRPRVVQRVLTAGLVMEMVLLAYRVVVGA
jgi:hypothetical protein